MILFCLFPAICFSEDFNIDIKTNQYSIYPGDILSFNSEIKNNVNTTQEFEISITNTNYPNWVTIKEYHFIAQPYETKKIVFYISPDIDAQKGTYTFDFDLSYNQNGTERNINRKVNFFVMQEGLVELKLDLQKTQLVQGEDASIRATVINDGIFDFKNVLLIIKFKEKNIVIEEKIPLLNKGEEKIFEKIFEFDEIEKIDKFTITAELYKTYLSGAKNNILDAKQVEGSILKKSKISTLYHENDENYIVSGEFTAQNKGNKAGESSFSLDILYPLSFYKFSRVPDEIITDKEHDKKIAIWNCNNIEPNQSCNISYSIDLKSFFYIKVFAVFFFFIYIFYIFSHQLYVNKKILKVSKTKTTISIEVKNNSGKILDKCEIIEFVPASLKIDSKFDAVPPDEIKRTKKGIQLKWIFKPLLRGEGRVMVYSVIPLLQTFDGITIAPTKITGCVKRKRYFKKSKSLNVR